MFIQIAEFVQLPQRMLPEICAELVWLKLSDDVDSGWRHSLYALQEFCFALWLVSFMYREHRVHARIATTRQAQLPSELV